MKFISFHEFINFIRILYSIEFELIIYFILKEFISIRIEYKSIENKKFDFDVYLYLLWSSFPSPISSNINKTLILKSNFSLNLFFLLLSLFVKLILFLKFIPDPPSVFLLFNFNYYYYKYGSIRFY